MVADYLGSGINQATVRYRKILAQNPRNSEILNLLVVIEIQRNNPSAAIELIDQAIQFDPNNAGFFANRGHVLQQLERFEDALASYDRALAIKPDYASVLLTRGNVLNQLKRSEDALESYDRALAVKP